MRRRRRRSDRPLAGQVVAITGGARGIGLAIATAMAHRGCKVALGDIDLEEAGTAAGLLGDDAFAVELDVTDRQSFEGFIAQVEERMGPIDILVNNAGIMVLGELTEEDDETADRMLDINLRGVLIGTKIAIARMRPRGRGHIVNIASQAGKVGFPAAATYTATKHAVVGLCEAARGELRDTGVEVSCVMPAVVTTRLAAGLRTPVGVPALEPEDVAEAVVDAVATGRFEVWVPRYSKLIVLTASLLPRSVSDALARLMGADRVLSGADRGVRAGYEAKAGRETEKTG